MAINWNKPLRTRDGFPARYVGPLKDAAYTRIVAVDYGCGESPVAVTEDGRRYIYSRAESIHDLENVPEVPKYRPLNATEMAELVGKKIYRKGLRYAFLVFSSGPEAVSIIERGFAKQVSASTLRDEFVGDDGRPLERLDDDMPF